MERDQAVKFIHELLRAMVAKRASDLFITAGFPPAFKLDGKMTPVSNQSLTPQHTQELARSLMNDKQAQEFEASKECNFAINPPGIGRFRVNAFVQQARVGIVLRTITTAIPKMEDLGLPPVLKDVAMTKRGLVILVGELRDLETIRLALTAAETGHLVFGTLHTSSAAKTVDRIIDVFPAAEKEMVRAMLSESLRAVISQTLCKTKDGTGRAAAHEIMIGTPAIRNLIREAKIAQMYSSIQTGQALGMQTLDQNLTELIKRNIITKEEARGKAANKDAFN